MRSLLTILLAVAIALPLGCGGDDESPAEPVSAPELSVPGEEQSTSETTDSEPTETTEPAPPAPVEPPPAPPPPPPPADSPENDQPPPKDSAAERFEQYCDENPGAC